MKLYTSDDEFHDAHLIADRGRARDVLIPRRQLKKILMDHAKMVGMLQKYGERLEKGVPDGNNAGR